MTPSITNTTAAGSTAATTSASLANATDSLANEGTFLQLLVAQLQNQDPENPQDGTQFVAQLAQFSSLEQEIQSRQDLDQIAQYDAAAQSAGASSASAGGGSGTASGSNAAANSMSGAKS